MTPDQIRHRRLDLGLTVEELACALQLTPDELRCIESGESLYCVTSAFEEAFAALEERVVGLLVGA